MRTFTRAACALLASAVFASAASAQTWPAKPVRVVVAFTAGGTTDILARSIGQQLSERLKQPFVIDNKPGAGGNLGTELVVRSRARRLHADRQLRGADRRQPHAVSRSCPTTRWPSWCRSC